MITRRSFLRVLGVGAAVAPAAAVAAMGGKREEAPPLLVATVPPFTSTAVREALLRDLQQLGNDAVEHDQGFEVVRLGPNATAYHQVPYIDDDDWDSGKPWPARRSEAPR